MESIRANSTPPILPIILPIILSILPQRGYIVPLLVLVAVGWGHVEGQTLQAPVTEVRILGADLPHDWGVAGQGGGPARDARGMTTAGARLTLPGGPAHPMAPEEAVSLKRRQQAAGPAGSTRIRLSLAEPVPAAPRRLKPPPARPEIATTWVPAGQDRSDAPSAAPPSDGGSVRLTFHAAVPGTPPTSAGRFPEDSRPATMDRPAWHQKQPGAAHPRASLPSGARAGAAHHGAGWALNPLRAGDSWHGR